MDKIAGVTEIGLMLGVTRQRAWKLTKHPEFPAPAHRLHMGDVWLVADIAKWAKRTGRTLRTI